jgi:hypothetical protein
MASTNLDRPPPVASVHLVIDVACSLGIRIVLFWGIDKLMCKFGVTEEGSDGWDNFMIMKFKVFATNTKVHALKGGWARQHLVDDVV